MRPLCSKFPALLLAVVFIAATLAGVPRGPTNAKGAYLVAETPEALSKDWRYYELPITIDNYKNQQRLTEYQVKVMIDTASLVSSGKMLPDGSDIRFLDSDGYSPLPFWIGEGMNTNATALWVRVPEIPSLGGTTITMVYGDEAAYNLSSGDDTFLLFDDFDDGFYDDRWSTALPGTGYAESGGTLLLESAGSLALYSKKEVWGPCVIETRARRTAGGEYETALGNGSASGVGMGIGNGGNNFVVGRFGAGFGGNASVILDNADDSWNVYSGLLHANEWRVFRGPLDGDWVSETNMTLGGYADDRTYRVQLRTNGTEGGGAEWDWVRVRRYADVEPAVIVGEEVTLVEDHLEVSPAAWTMTIGISRHFNATMFIGGDSFSVTPLFSVSGGGSVENGTFTAEATGGWTLMATYRGFAANVPIHVIEPVVSEGVVIEVGVDLGFPEGWMGARISAENDTIEAGTNGTLLGIGFDLDAGELFLDVGGGVGTANACEILVPESMIPDIDSVAVLINGTDVPRLDEEDSVQGTKAWDASSVIDGFTLGKANNDVRILLQMKQKSVKQRVAVLLKGVPSPADEPGRWCLAGGCCGIACFFTGAVAGVVAWAYLRRERDEDERF